MKTRIILAMVGFAIGFFVGNGLGVVGGFGGINGGKLFGLIGLVIGFLTGADGNQFRKRK